MRRVLAVAAAAAALIISAAPATASPVATNDGSFAVLGRVFPDPLANCQHSGGSVCSGNAQGNVPATQFIGIDEFVSAIRYMNNRPDPGNDPTKRWSRYMEIVPLDGKLGDGAGNGRSDIAGNDLPPEFTPDKDFASAGIPTSTLARKKSDLMVVRVTDESVPDAGKKRYALSLSIHGIERAGAEGGIRAMEDLVTAHSTDLLNKPIVPGGVKAGAPTFGDVLKKTIIYFTLPNPDGWRRGSVSSGPDGGVFFQRYNGNGVDPNRDWPDIGYAFRGYSAVSEPETKAWISFYDQVRQNRGPFAAGDDLHGQPEADALSFTLLPHGRHRWDKNARIADTAKVINRSTFDRIQWSPIVQGNDQPQGGGAPCVPAPLGATCAKIYAQTWGSVYDTINYTTTGALGDWFDSSLGLRADGIDNEMSFSHLDKNITFDPHTEQLHVDGNKALIYAHLANIVEPPASPAFDVGGRKGYVPNLRVKRAATASQPDAPPGSEPQPDETPAENLVDPTGPGTAFAFEVKRGPQPNGKNYFNGGLRAEVTTANAQGIGTGLVAMKVQCQHCDEHPGVKDDQEWVTVAEDFNQSFLYAQSGVTATVNHPQPFDRQGKAVPWRVLVTGPAGVAKVVVHFTSGRASEDGDTGGGTPPEQRAYDVANTDFFKDLNPFIFWLGQEMNTINPRAVIDGTQNLNSFDTIALADDPLPGYTGTYGGAAAHPSGSPTADFTFSGSVSVPGGGSGAPGTSEEKAFTIAPNEANKRATIKVTWANGANDFDLYVWRVEADGTRTQVGSSAGSPPATAEEAIVVEPIPGNYVIEVQNYAAPDPTWQGTAKFTPFSDPPASSSKFTEAEKDTWLNKLKTWVQGGGNLVLTDGALRALPELAGLPAAKISKQTVYAGQSAFSTGTGDTLGDPLAKDVAQPGARFNTGMRRQMYEPTPLGFAIQNTLGADSSFAQQFDVERAAWEAAGGRTVATSADAGARNAKAVNSRVTIGELKIGQGDIRIAGALLPQPVEEFDHQFGLEPYATTYTGYTMARNLLQPIPSRAGNGAGNAGGGPGGGGTGGGGGSTGGGGTAGGVNTVGGRFIISRKLVRLKNRRAKVHVSCRAPSGCKGTLRLQGRLRRADPEERQGQGRERAPGWYWANLGSAKFNYKGKRNAVITVTLSKRLARLVSKQRRTSVRATAPVRFGDGRKGTARATFWLYRR